MARGAACKRSWQECRTLPYVTGKRSADVQLPQPSCTSTHMFLRVLYLCGDNDPCLSQRIKESERMLCGIIILRAPYGKMQPMSGLHRFRKQPMRARDPAPPYALSILRCQLRNAPIQATGPSIKAQGPAKPILQYFRRGDGCH